MHPTCSVCVRSKRVERRGETGPCNTTGWLVPGWDERRCFVATRIGPATPLDNVSETSLRIHLPPLPLQNDSLLSLATTLHCNAVANELLATGPSRQAVLWAVVPTRLMVWPHLLNHPRNLRVLHHNRS